MAGKPGKSRLTTWHDDAQLSIDQLWDEIEARFGICPSFFKLAQVEPPIARNLFRQAEFAYLDNPMPAHFKEQLFTWLSRFCEARYCVARHCAFLIGRGRVAAAAGAPPLSAERALALLKELMPDKEELPGYLRALEATSAPLGDWPDFDTDLGRRFRVACAVVFLDPVHAASWLRELRRLLGPQRYEQLMLFLAFVRAEHFWTEVHPELEFEPDLEAMLRDSETRFRAIFENAAVGIARVAPDGHWLEVNQRLCDIVGYSREELMTKTFADITHPDDLEPDLRAMRRISAGEIDTFLMEKRYCRKDSSVTWVNLTVSVMRKADGSPDYFISIVEDISARKWAKEELRESQERLQIFFEHSPASLAMFDREMRYIAASRRWMTDYRVGAIDIIGQSHYALFPEVPERWKAAHRRSLEGEVVRADEDRFVRADGKVQWVRWETRPWHAADGAIGGIVIFTEEITGRKLAEEALRESELRFRTMISAIPNLSYETDADGANIFTSDQWRAYTGMTAEESAGTGFIRAYHPDEAEDVLAQWRAAVRSGVSFERKCRIRAADGSYRWFLNRAQPGRDAEGRIVRWAGSLTDIDDLVRAEERVRENELRFRTMISAVPSLTFETDADGFNTFASDQWCAYTGMTAEETAGIGFARAIHPDDAETATARWFAAVRSGMPFESRHRLRAVDGSYRWFLCRALPGRDAEGRIVRWAGSLVDIDDLIRIEDALRESEGRFRQLAESLPLLVWTCRADGTCDYVNPQFVAYTGIPEAKQLGFDWLRQIHPDDREPLFAAWKRTVATGEPFDIEYRIRRNDGVYRWFKTRAVALRDSGGKVVKWFGSNTDIDDQMQAERSLLESKERLNGIVSSAMDSIITVDEEQRIVLFNEAAERMFGCPAAEALGQPFNRFIPERFRGAHTELVRRFGETGGSSRAMRSLIALRADGTEFPIEAAISKVEVGGRKLYTFIQRDITERKQAEAEREQLAREQVARASAEAANRSKDEFLAMVSHELRSPLNAILGYTRMLRSGPADREAINNVAAVVERSAKAQLQIIEDLLDSARIITGKLRIEPGPVDLVPALEAALDTVRSAAEAKSVTLVANFGPLPEQVLGDSTRLQQVVWNLLSNAVKFTPEGGRVELRMEGADDHIHITVSDTGKGIEPEFLPFVFERFRQADASHARRFGGLGLGLSLVKHLVELHSGTITAASEGRGCGATFTVK